MQSSLVLYMPDLTSGTLGEIKDSHKQEQNPLSPTHDAFNQNTLI